MGLRSGLRASDRGQQRHAVPLRAADQSVVRLIDVPGTLDQVLATAPGARTERADAQRAGHSYEAADVNRPMIGAVGRERDRGPDEKAVVRRDERVRFVRRDRREIGEQPRVEAGAEEAAERRDRSTAGIAEGNGGGEAGPALQKRGWCDDRSREELTTGHFGNI